MSIPRTTQASVQHPLPPEISTKRLILRPFIMADFEDYAAMLADPEVMRFIGGGKPMSRDLAWLNLAQLLGHWSLTGFGLYAVALQATGELVGRVGLYSPEGWPGLEIGWCLRRQFWGQGLALEAALPVREAARHCYPEDALMSMIHQENRRSVLLAERLGGVTSRVFKMARQDIMVFSYS